MKTTCLAILTGLICLSAPTTPAAAADDILDLIATAPAAADHPLADAVVLKQDVVYSVDKNGRMTRRERTVTKLMTDWAVRNLCDPRPAWDSSRQKLEIHVARTFMRDGTEVPTPPNGFNEVTPDAVSRCADLLGHREMVVSHVGAEIGCVIELDYEIEDLRPGPLPAAAREELGGRWPILVKTVTVDAPGAEVEIVHDEFLAAPAVVDGAGDEPRTWTVRDVPALPLERGETRVRDLRPALFFSTVEGWRGLSSRLRALARDTGELDPALTAWLESPVDDQGEPRTDLTALDTIERIADLVGNRMRTVRHDRPWSHQPRPAADVYSSLAATPWEKAVLSWSLLDSRGLPAEIGYFGPGAGVPLEAAAPQAFSDFRISIRVDDQNWWIVPENGSVFPGRCDLDGFTGFFPEDSAASFRRYVVSGLDGGSRLLIDLTPDPENGCRAEVSWLAEGGLWEMDPAADMSELAAGLLSGVLIDPEVSDLRVMEWSPFKVDLRFVATGSLPEAENDLVVVDLPRPPRTVVDALPPGFRANARARALPLLIERGLEQRLRLRLTPPEGLVFDAVPPAIERKAGKNSLRLFCSLVDGRLEVDRSLTVAKGAVAPDDFPALRDLVADAQRPAANRLILMQSAAE